MGGEVGVAGNGVEVRVEFGVAVAVALVGVAGRGVLVAPGEQGAVGSNRDP